MQEIHFCVCKITTCVQRACRRPFPVRRARDENQCKITRPELSQLIILFADSTQQKQVFFGSGWKSLRFGVRQFISIIVVVVVVVVIVVVVVVIIIIIIIIVLLVLLVLFVLLVLLVLLVLVVIAVVIAVLVVVVVVVALLSSSSQSLRLRHYHHSRRG